jgi:predicted RNase H-like HicB family nuclease
LPCWSVSIELTVVYEKVEGGRIQATIPAVPGTITTGRTKAEARRNVRDALRLTLTTLPDAARDARDTERLELRLGSRARPRDLDDRGLDR